MPDRAPAKQSRSRWSLLRVWRRAGKTFKIHQTVDAEPHGGPESDGSPTTNTNKSLLEAQQEKKVVPDVVMEALKKTWLFQEVTPATLLGLARAMIRTEVKRDQSAVLPRGLLVVESGHFQALDRCARTGRESRKQHIGPGDCIGAATLVARGTSPKGTRCWITPESPTLTDAVRARSSTRRQSAIKSRKIEPARRDDGPCVIWHLAPSACKVAVVTAARASVRTATTRLQVLPAMATVPTHDLQRLLLLSELKTAQKGEILSFPSVATPASDDVDVDEPSCDVVAIFLRGSVVVSDGEDDGPSAPNLICYAHIGDKPVAASKCEYLVLWRAAFEKLVGACAASNVLRHAQFFGSVQQHPACVATTQPSLLGTDEEQNAVDALCTVFSIGSPEAAALLGTMRPLTLTAGMEVSTQGETAMPLGLLVVVSGRVRVTHSSSKPFEEEPLPSAAGVLKPGQGVVGAGVCAASGSAAESESGVRFCMVDKTTQCTYTVEGTPVQCVCLKLTTIALERAMTRFPWLERHVLAAVTTTSKDTDFASMPLRGDRQFAEEAEAAGRTNVGTDSPPLEMDLLAVDASKLKLGKVLGRGMYGQVKSAILQTAKCSNKNWRFAHNNVREKRRRGSIVETMLDKRGRVVLQDLRISTCMPVAVKLVSLKSFKTRSDFLALFHERRLLARLAKHGEAPSKFVMRLLGSGQVVAKRQLFLLEHVQDRAAGATGRPTDRVRERHMQMDRRWRRRRNRRILRRLSVPRPVFCGA